MIKRISVNDKRYPLKGGAGSDAIHKEPVYSYAVTELYDDKGQTGIGLAFTVGSGNELVCMAAKFYAEKLIGKDIEEMMRSFGRLFKELSDEQQYRWIGPHKGVAHLGLASVTNACFDLWAKSRKQPLWKLLIGLSAEEMVDLLDLSYLEDELTRQQAIDLIGLNQYGKDNRAGIINSGYPGYDTSVGWFNYSDDQIRENVKKAIDKGFTAMKLKVGARNSIDDLRRAEIVRSAAGQDATIMLDANQQWTLPQALIICKQLQQMNPYWIEEPTHPDDVLAHKVLADAVAPLKLALGEHVPNRVLFKNYLQSACAGFIQVDAVRVGGVSEFLTVSLLSKKFGVPVVPHVGDMGQLHQHLVLVNHIVFGHEALFLEHIPHLKHAFVHPVQIINGKYQVPTEAGSSCDLNDA